MASISITGTELLLLSKAACKHHSALQPGMVRSFVMLEHSCFHLCSMVKPVQGHHIFMAQKDLSLYTNAGMTHIIYLLLFSRSRQPVSGGTGIAQLSVVVVMPWSMANLCAAAV